MIDKPRTDHLRAVGFGGSYVTALRCTLCGKSVDVPCLVPGLDDEYAPIRDKFVRKHQSCAKGA